MNSVGTQGLVDARYRILKTGALAVLSLDVFYFFACYLTATLSGENSLEFAGLLKLESQAILPVLLKYTVLGFVIVSLPLVIHGKKLALAIDVPKDGSPAARKIESVESAFAHYRHTFRLVFGVLTLVNFSAAIYYLAHGQFWLLVLASCVGFLNKLIVFPGPRRFDRWMWRALEAAGGPAGT